MNFLSRLLRPPADPPATALYNAIVGMARDPRWFTAGGVPDTIDGRFDMVALIVALVLARLEALPDTGQLSADVTERFIADMDGSLRQLGFGDPSVGKQVGNMVSALGGRLGAYRAAGTDDSALRAALIRNLWRGVSPGVAAEDWTLAKVRQVQARLSALDADALAAARL